MYNAYGPTETTIWATLALVEGRPAQVAIGRPIANMQVFVVDRNLGPVPTGVTGELCVAGPGLARGYLGLPGRTAETFVPNPFSREPGARMYRTGDLVRYWGDGTLEFLGRADQQVKIRGHRVELAEIEAALLGHPQVRQALALAHERVDSDRRIVGYVVGTGTSLDPYELRSFLSARLPAYMLPSSFVLLSELPLTANGKIDRQALPVPEYVSAKSTDGEPPSDGIEQTIAEIWKEILHLKSVGRDDNFFDVGGHSLLLARVHQRLTEVLPSGIPLVELFQFPSIRLLASRLSDRRDLKQNNTLLARAQRRRAVLERRAAEADCAPKQRSQ
jgi:hypothetical protein